MGKTQTEQPINPTIHAKQIAQCIKNGMDPRKLANYAFAQGAEFRQFVLALALMQPADLAQKFRDDSEAWKYLEPAEGQLLPFLEAFIGRAGELAAELKAAHEKKQPAAPGPIAETGEAPSRPEPAGEAPQKPVFGQFDPIAGRRVP